MDSHTLFSLEGKKILVTGAGGHLGRVLCEYLVFDGAEVFAVDVNQHGLDQMRAELGEQGDSIVTFCADLASESDRVELSKSLREKTDYLDGAVFAAAFVGTSELEGWAVDFADQSLSAWRAALELNLTAPFHLTQLLEGLLRNGTNPSIVNVGSIYGSLAPDWGLYQGLDMANPAGYGASKGGLVQLTRWLASALAPDIRVNMVSPGGIARDQPEDFVRRYEAKTPLGRMATEQDMMGAIVSLLSRSASYVTGQNLIVDGGFGIH